jgi:hypothetical protein
MIIYSNSQNKSENASRRLFGTSSAQAVDAKFSSAQQVQTGFGYYSFHDLNEEVKK